MTKWAWPADSAANCAGAAGGPSVAASSAEDCGASPAGGPPSARLFAWDVHAATSPAASTIQRGEQTVREVTVGEATGGRAAAVADPSVSEELFTLVPDLRERLAFMAALAGVADDPSAFSAAKLWEGRDLTRKIITHAAYQAIGGVGGALAVHADDVIGAMNTPAQRLAQRIFRSLVTPERTRAVVELLRELREGHLRRWPDLSSRLHVR